MASKIKCLREPGRYFESEFRHNPDGTIKTPYIHERGNPHYINGMLVNPGKDPLTVWRVQNLESEMDSLLLEIDPEFSATRILKLVMELKNLAMGLLEEDLQNLINQAKEMFSKYGDSIDDGGL